MEETVKPVVLVIDKVYQKARRIFDSVEDFKILTTTAEENALSEVIKEENAFAVVLGGDKYTGALYESLGNGGLIARFGVGYDGIDLRQAKENNLLVTNTPEVLESTVAEFTIFLAAEVLRKVGAMNVAVRQGNWSPCMGNDLHTKVWAIIGMGKIGERLSRILSFGFGVRVLALKSSHVATDKMRQECGVEEVFSDFTEMAPLADIISLHLPAKKDTYHFLDQARLEQLKPGAFLINTGRGTLIDENALYDVLAKGKLAGAGLDVFEHEPYRPMNPDKDLRSLPNVVLTPHMASSTLECSGRMAERVIQNIRFAYNKQYEKMDIVAG